MNAIDTGEFAGRRVLVTGGTQGMGAAVVALMAARGAIHGAEHLIDGGTMPTV